MCYLTDSLNITRCSKIKYEAFIAQPLQGDCQGHYDNVGHAQPHGQKM